MEKGGCLLVRVLWCLLWTDESIVVLVDMEGRELFLCLFLFICFQFKMILCQWHILGWHALNPFGWFLGYSCSHTPSLLIALYPDTQTYSSGLQVQGH